MCSVSATRRFPTTSGREWLHSILARTSHRTSPRHSLGASSTRHSPQKEHATRTSARISSETINAATSTSRFKTHHSKTLKSRSNHATTGGHTWMGGIGWAVRRTAAVWHGRGPGAQTQPPQGKTYFPVVEQDFAKVRADDQAAKPTV